MVIKLCKKDGDRMQYWEGFDWQKKVAFRRGVVGQNADAEIVQPIRGKGTQALIETRAAEMRSQGFSTMEPEGHHSLIVQYHIDGFGTEEDLDRRDRVEEAIHDDLGIMGAGAVDGGDTGSGTMSVFCFVVEPGAILTRILERLRKEGLLEGAVIAVRPPSSSGESEHPLRVMWPPDFKGEFSVI